MNKLIKITVFCSLLSSVIFGYNFIYQPIQTPYELYQKEMQEESEQIAQNIIAYQQNILQECYQSLQSGAMKADAISYIRVIFQVQNQIGSSFTFVYGLTNLFKMYGLQINQTFTMNDLAQYFSWYDPYSYAQEEQWLFSQQVNIFVLLLRVYNPKLLEALYLCGAHPTCDTMLLFDFSLDEAIQFWKESKNFKEKQNDAEVISIAYRSCDSLKQKELLQRYPEIKNIV